MTLLLMMIGMITVIMLSAERDREPVVESSSPRRGKSPLGSYIILID